MIVDHSGELIVCFPFVIRLAMQYLKSMKEESDNSDVESDDSVELTDRLRRERLESQGMYFRYASGSNFVPFKIYL